MPAPYLFCTKFATQMSIFWAPSDVMTDVSTEKVCVVFAIVVEFVLSYDATVVPTATLEALGVIGVPTLQSSEPVVRRTVYTVLFGGVDGGT